MYELCDELANNFKAQKMSEKSQKFIELKPNDQCFSQNPICFQNYQKVFQKPKLNFYNFLEIELFDVKTRPCLKYFVKTRPCLKYFVEDCK